MHVDGLVRIKSEKMSKVTSEKVDKKTAIHFDNVAALPLLSRAMTYSSPK